MFHFGNTKAALTLVKELKHLNSKTVARKALRFFTDSSRKFNIVSAFEYTYHHTDDRVFLLDAIRKHYISSIDATQWPANIKSLLKNVLKAQYVKHVKGL